MRKRYFAVALVVVILVVSIPRLTKAWPTPQYAVFSGVSNPGDRMGFGPNLSNVSLVLNDRSRWTYGSPWRLWVPPDGSAATLRFMGRRNGRVTDLGAQLTIAARRNMREDPASFSFPCRVGGDGAAIIGWEGGRGSACSNPQGLRITSGSYRRVSSNPSFTALSKLQSLQAQNIEIVDTNRRYFCNALPDSQATKAGIVINGTSLQDACDRAIQKCSQKNSGSECVPINLGEWSERDPHLILSLIREDNQSSILSGPTTGADVTSALRLFSRIPFIDGATVFLGRLFPGIPLDSYLVDLYSSDTVIVTPATSDYTVAFAESFDDRVEVTALQGDVIIRSAERSQGEQLQQGYKYTYYGDFTQAVGRAEEKILSSQELVALQSLPIYQEFAQQAGFGEPDSVIALDSLTITSPYGAIQNGAILTYWQGSKLTGTLKINFPAPEGGVDIIVSSDDPYFQDLPERIRIEAGQQESTPFEFSTVSRGNYPSSVDTVIRAMFGSSEYKVLVRIEEYPLI